MTFSISFIYIISHKKKGYFYKKTKRTFLSKSMLKIDEGLDLQILVFKTSFNPITLYKNI